MTNPTTHASDQGKVGRAQASLATRSDRRRSSDDKDRRVPPLHLLLGSPHMRDPWPMANQACTHHLHPDLDLYLDRGDVEALMTPPEDASGIGAPAFLYGTMTNYTATVHLVAPPHENRGRRESTQRTISRHRLTHLGHAYFIPEDFCLVLRAQARHEKPPPMTPSLEDILEITIIGNVRCPHGRRPVRRMAFSRAYLLDRGMLPADCLRRKGKR